MSVRLSCPSCNTSFALGAVPADRRATCPRCGDAFPVRGEVAESESPPAAAPHPAPLAPRPQARAFRRNAVVAVSLLLVALAAALAIYYARKPAPRPEAPPEPAPVVNATATPPAQLAGLGYLPAECNAVFAMQPGPALARARRANQPPHELLASLGIPPQVLGALALLGVAPEQIDHVAGGALVGDEGDEPRVAVALVLRQPLANEQQFLAALKAKPVGKQESRWSVNPGNLPVSPVLAKASPTAWVFGLGEKDLSALGKKPGAGGAQFRGGVRAMVAAVPSDAAAWVALDDDRDWSEKPLVKLALQTAQGKKWLPAAGALKEFRGGFASVSLGEHPQLRLHVRCADDAAGARLRGYFQARAAEVTGATAGGEGASATFNAPFDPAATGPLLQRMLDDAKK